jgi:hypothetical protein
VGEGARDEDGARCTSPLRRTKRQHNEAVAAPLAVQAAVGEAAPLRRRRQPLHPRAVVVAHLVRARVRVRVRVRARVRVRVRVSPPG